VPQSSTTRLTFLTLRVAAAMCFIGHGAFGIITKKVWCNYFAVFGIGPDLAYRLMPVVGTIDILLGISLLVRPTRAVFGWLVFWGTMTALLRPLSGEPFAEAVERGGNYGVPLTMLLLCGVTARPADWLSRLDASAAKEDALARVQLCLRVVVCLLLAGHGWLNLLHKQSLLDQYAGLGFGDPLMVANLVGCFEVVAAFGMLVRPVRSVLVALVVWKMATELFYPHWEVFEWIERGGSYGAILSLWLVLPSRTARQEATSAHPIEV
jgi:uncharacterized membrane protein YphA (DoxX/SURF4 family)